MSYPDFRPAPNQGGRPDLYELENRAMDPGHLVLDAMRELAPWAGKVLLDLGCGSGYWLPGYAGQAAAVIGVEPDPALVEFGSRADFEAVLRLEFGADVADPWLAAHPAALGLSYGYVLFAATKVLGDGARALGGRRTWRRTLPRTGAHDLRIAHRPERQPWAVMPRRAGGRWSRCRRPSAMARGGPAGARRRSTGRCRPGRPGRPGPPGRAPRFSRGLRRVTLPGRVAGGSARTVATPEVTRQPLRRAIPLAP